MSRKLAASELQVLSFLVSTYTEVLLLDGAPMHLSTGPSMDGELKLGVCDNEPLGVDMIVVSTIHVHFI